MPMKNGFISTAMVVANNKKTVLQNRIGCSLAVVRRKLASSKKYLENMTPTVLFIVRQMASK